MAFTPVITSAGVAAAIAANNLGLDLQITHIALGAGAYNPTGAETALQDRRETAAVGPGSRTDGDTITINAVLPSSAYAGAPYNICEVGFFAGNPASGGTLFAVASASGESFGSRSSVVADFVVTIAMTLQGVPAGSVTVTVDENAGASFKLIEEHEAAGNPHPQYLLKSGGTMTGALVLSGNAVSALHPVPLQQLESFVAAAVAAHTAAEPHLPAYQLPFTLSVRSAPAVDPGLLIHYNGVYYRAIPDAAGGEGGPQ